MTMVRILCCNTNKILLGWCIVNLLPSASELLRSSREEAAIIVNSTDRYVLYNGDLPADFY